MPSPHHTELAEVGPRFEMKLYEIKLGTMDHKDADTEWIHRPYMNNAKKKRIL
jgi:U3 small nucleolar ribonucleoprotein protein IMP4